MARVPIGKPKIAGFMAESADLALYLYQRRRGETFVVLHDLSAGKAGAGKLKVGARFTGRFYPSRCDLSPDGRHFVYFVMGGAQKGTRQRLYCWTAMCQPPSLTAVFLLPQDDTWGGGGTFLDNRTVLIEAGMYDDAERISTVHDRSFGGVKVMVSSAYVQVPEPAGVKTGRPRRDDGWKSTLKGKPAPGKQEHAKTAKRVTLVRRLHDHEARRGDFNRWAYELLGSNSNALLPSEFMATVTWADFDRKGRLFLARSHNLHVWLKPHAGMKLEADHVLDLEEATAPQ